MISTGQGESGKRYTLFGEDNLIYSGGSVDHDTSDDSRGLVTRIGSELFNTIHGPGISDQYKISVSVIVNHLDRVMDVGLYTKESLESGERQDFEHHTIEQLER